MTPDAVSTEIRRWCRILRLGILLFVLAVLCLYAAVWIWPQVNIGHQPGQFVLQSAQAQPDAIQSLAAGDRLLLALAGLPYFLALGYALYRLDHLLRNFQRGEFFDAATVGHLRAFSGYVLVAKVVALITMHIRGFMLLQMLGPQIRAHMGIRLSNDDIAVLLMCALFFLVARMMEEGRRLAEENREFV